MIYLIYLCEAPAAVVVCARPARADGDLVAVARVHDAVVGALPLAVRLGDVDAGRGAEGEGQQHKRFLHDVHRVRSFSPQPYDYLRSRGKQEVPTHTRYLPDSVGIIMIGQ